MEERILQTMSNAVGNDIKAEMLIKFPSEDCSHMGQTWEVYGARWGEFTLIAYVYSENNIVVNII